MNISNKSLVITLALSIGLNVFLGSFIAARVLHRRAEMAHESGYGPFLGPRGMMRDHKGPAADKVRDLMRRQGDTFRTERGRLRDAQLAVGTALAAEPFDAAALTRALGELRASTVRSQELMHASLVELARDLPAEQRRELAHGRRGLGRGMAGRGF
jgi:uncharacterized membrane protein